MSLTKRFSHGFEFLASYTLSKAEDNSRDFFVFPDDMGAGRNPADPTGVPLGFDPASERGPSFNDQRHRFVLSGLVQLPWSMRTSAILSAASGRPFTPIAGADMNGDGESSSDRARRNPADPLQPRGPAQRADARPLQPGRAPEPACSAWARRARSS